MTVCRRSMLKGLCVAICVLWSSATPAPAEEYRITVPNFPISKPANEAITVFERELEKEDTDARLRFIPGFANPDEILGMLHDGTVDIAVVPIDVVPALVGSPLLRPFLAQDAAEIRQAIESEVGAFEKADVERDGHRVLDFWHVSSTILGSQTPVLQPLDDLRGRKIYDGVWQPDDTLLALGATRMQMPLGEVVPALRAGEIDATAVPLDDRADSLGFAELIKHYVDRIYRPKLYAVLVTDQRWTQIPFPHQHYLAKAANTVGESLVGGLEAQATEFRSDQLALGSVFNSWTTEDVASVRVASIGTIDVDAFVDRQLVTLAFDSAAALPPPSIDGDALPASEVMLLFATDRKREDLTKPETAFSSSRRLMGHTFGLATIYLEDGRRLGDNLKEVSQVAAVRKLEEVGFWNRFQIAADQEVVVFVHGYNNAFTDSIRRGATIQQDVAPRAIVVSYTWPSDGELLSYGYDESSIDIAEQNFELFMDQLIEKVAANRINVIAHSMGSRLLIKYLAGLPRKRVYPEDVMFKNVIFAAADVSTDFFRQKEETPPYSIYPLSSYAERITVYSSQHDRALGLSEKLHGDQRLGLADETNMYLEADISAIDASLIDPARWYQRFSFATRHSYVFDKAAGVKDLKLLLAGVDPGARPNMNRGIRNGLDYWVLAP